MKKTKVYNGYLVNGVRITKYKTFWIISKHEINPSYTPAGNPWYKFDSLNDAVEAATKVAA